MNAKPERWVTRGNHLLPRGLLLPDERVRNDCAYGLVPRPIRVDIHLPKQVKKRPLTLHGRESIIGHKGIVGEILSDWERRDRQRPWDG